MLPVSSFNLERPNRAAVQMNETLMVNLFVFRSSHCRIDGLQALERNPSHVVRRRPNLQRSKKVHVSTSYTKNEPFAHLFNDKTFDISL